MIRASSPALMLRETAASTVSQARLRILLVFAIVAMALLIRLYGISLYTLEIDEYGSIAEGAFVHLGIALSA